MVAQRAAVAVLLALLVYDWQVARATHIHQISHPHALHHHEHDRDKPHSPHEPNRFSLDSRVEDEDTGGYSHYSYDIRLVDGILRLDNISCPYGAIELIGCTQANVRFAARPILAQDTAKNAPYAGTGEGWRVTWQQWLRSIRFLVADPSLRCGQPDGEPVYLHVNSFDVLQTMRDDDDDDVDTTAGSGGTQDDISSKLLQSDRLLLSAQVRPAKLTELLLPGSTISLKHFPSEAVHMPLIRRNTASANDVPRSRRRRVVVETENGMSVQEFNMLGETAGFGVDTCVDSTTDTPLYGNGRCDEGRFGASPERCDEKTDATDCSQSQRLEFGVSTSGCECLTQCTSGSCHVAPVCPDYVDPQTPAQCEACDEDEGCDFENTCHYRHNGECEEASLGGFGCKPGSDTDDCAAVDQLLFGAALQQSSAISLDNCPCLSECRGGSGSTCVVNPQRYPQCRQASGFTVDGRGHAGRPQYRARCSACQGLEQCRLGNNCAFANNDVCDEGARCPDGQDTADCERLNLEHHPSTKDGCTCLSECRANSDEEEPSCVVDSTCSDGIVSCPSDFESLGYSRCGTCSQRDDLEYSRDDVEIDLTRDITLLESTGQDGAMSIKCVDCGITMRFGLEFKLDIGMFCPPGKNEVAGLCYKVCPDDYPRGIAHRCYKPCPSYLRDDGLYCGKPAGSEYLKPAGSKCREGYKPFGCCICNLRCPSGFKDIGVSCQKASINRGLGTPMKLTAKLRIVLAGDIEPTFTVQALLDGSVEFDTRRPVPYIGHLLKSLGSKMRALLGPLSLIVAPSFGLDYRVRFSASGFLKLLTGARYPQSFEVGYDSWRGSGNEVVNNIDSKIVRVGPLLEAKMSTDITFSLIPYIQLTMLSLVKVAVDFEPYVRPAVDAMQGVWMYAENQLVGGPITFSVSAGMDISLHVIFTLFGLLDETLYSETWQVIDPVLLLEKDLSSTSAELALPCYENDDCDGWSFCANRIQLCLPCEYCPGRHDCQHHCRAATSSTSTSTSTSTSSSTSTSTSSSTSSSTETVVQDSSEVLRIRFDMDFSAVDVDDVKSIIRAFLIDYLRIPASHIVRIDVFEGSIVVELTIRKESSKAVRDAVSDGELEISGVQGQVEGASSTDAPSASIIIGAVIGGVAALVIVVVVLITRRRRSRMPVVVPEYVDEKEVRMQANPLYEQAAWGCSDI